MLGLFSAQKSQKTDPSTTSFQQPTPPLPTASTPLNSSTTARSSSRSLTIFPAPPPPQSHPNIQLTQDELIEIRALQRTFEGAYTRTALSQFSFALLVLKIFTHEFYSVGALFAGFGVCVFAVSVLRRREGNKQFFVEKNKESVGSSEGNGGEERRFRTSGNVVCAVSAVSVCAYVALLVLVLRVGKS